MSLTPVHLAAALICAAVAGLIHQSRIEARRTVRARQIEMRLDALTTVVLLTRAGPALNPGSQSASEGGAGDGDRRPVVPDEEGR